MATATVSGQAVGKVIQVIGPVVDAEYETGHLPNIYNAIRITGKVGDANVDIVCEVQQHLGEDRVRAVAMKPTDGLQRGMDATDTGAPITVPVGAATLGRVLNVLGEPVDYPARPVNATEHWPLPRPPPTPEPHSADLKLCANG